MSEKCSTFVGGMRISIAHIFSQACRMVCVLGLMCGAMCGLSSCGWQRAKEVIATAERMDKTEHVVYDDTAAIAGVIRTLDNPVGWLFCRNTLGKAYYFMGRNLEDNYQQVAEAANCYIEADRLQIDDPIYRGRVNSCMGYICAQNNSDSLALIFYERASENFKAGSDEWRYAHTLLDRSEFHVERHDYIAADSLLQIAQTYKIDSAYWARYIETKGLFQYELQQYDSALIYFKQGLEYWPSEEDRCFSYFKIMQAYYNINMLDGAICYAQKIVSNSNNPNYISNAYYCLMLQAKLQNNTKQLSQYASVREDMNRVLEERKEPYTVSMAAIEAYLLNPHPMRKGRIALIVSLCVCIIFAICLLIYMRRNRTAYDQIDTLISHVQKQAEDIQEKQRLLDFETNISNIIEKYNTPHKRWRKYSLLRRDLDVWLYNWFEALDALPLTEKEKIYCAVSLIYTHLTDVELSDFMCFAKESIRIFKHRMLKKIEVSSSDFPQFLHDLSN